MSTTRYFAEITLFLFLCPRGDPCEHHEITPQWTGGPRVTQMSYSMKNIALKGWKWCFSFFRPQQRNSRRRNYLLPSEVAAVLGVQCQSLVPDRVPEGQCHKETPPPEIAAAGGNQNWAPWWFPSWWEDEKMWDRWFGGKKTLFGIYSYWGWVFFQCAAIYSGVRAFRPSLFPEGGSPAPCLITGYHWTRWNPAVV